MEDVKVGICEPKDFSESAINLLSKKCKVSFFQGMNLKSFISDKDAIFIRLKYQITDDLINDCCNLKYICSPTTGLNHISVTNEHIKVISLKGEYNFLESIRATPEHVFGLSLALLRNYSRAFLNNTNTLWNREIYKGYELYQNKVGIIGLGRIGKILSNYYQAFSAEVGYYDIVNYENISAIKYDSIEELINASSIIILATNYTPENRGMIGKSEISLMKGKYFINAARGELVDEKELIKKIREHWFKGVAIDVLANETLETHYLNQFIELTQTENLIITPHIGGATYTSMARTEEFIVKKFLDCIGE